MKRPPTIVLDLGGVLVENVIFEALAALLPAPVDAGQLRRRWLASASVRAFELGRCDSAELAAGFVAEWDLGVSASVFLADFAAWPRGFLPGALKLVAELRRDHTVACLSNCNELHWTRFGGFATEFDAAFSSHLLGCMKPDRDAFEAALERLAVEPGETFFFDGSPASVEAARRLGMRARLADGPWARREALAAEGLCGRRASHGPRP